MTKFRGLAPRFRSLPPRFGSAVPVTRQGRDRERDQREWRKWYKTARWQRLRMTVLVRDLFTCQWPGCGRIEADTSKLVADHREPHRGDEAMFWDADNLQCLCKPCHDSRKQRAENRGHR